ncbi:MAG: HU family DNA-binding protein [Niameybacter sp.]
MTRNDYVKVLSEKLETTQKNAKEVLGVVEDSIVEVMAKEDELSLSIGKFIGVDKAASTARNPKTGEEVEVPAKRTCKFRAGKAMKDGIN